MKVNILTIGDEILIGQTVDTNSAWMATQLNRIGAEIHRILTVSDVGAEIIDGIESCLSSADIVLMTGGLGPTKDDVTKKSIAHFLGDNMCFDQPTYDRIVKLFQRWNRKPTEAHREQCYMPESAKLLFNKMGTAPGMWFDYKGKVLVSMPGVPYEMKYLMTNEVIPKLQVKFPGKPIEHRTLLTVGEGESRIADRIKDFTDQLPEHIKIAYLPSLAKVKLRLTGRGDNQSALSQELDQAAKVLKSKVDDILYGEEEISLEAAIGKSLKALNMSLVTAESCTGGYLSHLITSVPGSSNYYLGSVIAYDNEVKKNQLKVKPETLEKHGAVSEATVKEMVQGALRLFKADLAVAISGVAGPGGGSEAKPVGTVWVAVGNQNYTETYLVKGGKDRVKNIQYSATLALDQIRKYLTKYYPKQK